MSTTGDSHVTTGTGGDDSGPGGYKRGRGEQALDPYHNPSGDPSKERKEKPAGGQGKPAKDVWTDLAMPTLAKRKGFGSLGPDIRLYANVFKLGLEQGRKIYVYDVDFTTTSNTRPGFKWNKEDAVRAWAGFASSHPGLGIESVAFDGFKNAYSPFKIPFPLKKDCVPEESGELTQGQFDVQFQLGTRTKTWTISLGLASTIELSKLMEYTNPTGADDERPAEVAADVPPTLQALDILVRAHVREAGWTIQAGQGRKHYQPNGHATLLSHGAEVLRGLFQSVRPTISGPVLQLDTAYSAFIKGGDMKTVCLALSGQGGFGGGGGGGRGRYGGGRCGYEGGRGGYGGGGHGGHAAEPDWRLMKKYLKGAKVKFAHREVPAAFTIWGFSKRGAHEETFDSTPRPPRGEPAPERPPPPQKMTVADYYRDKYNIALNHPTWPCVELKEKRMRVPVELVVLLPGQPVGFTLMKPEQTAAMIKVAGKGPQQRKSEIDQTRAEAGYDTQRFNDWGVKIDPEMTRVMGRVLPAPTIQYHPRSQVSSPRVTGGNWNLNQSQFVKPGVPLQSWGWLSFDPRMRVEEVRDYARSFMGVAKHKGMIVESNPLIHRGSHDLLRSLKVIGKMCIDAHKRPPQLLMVIVPDRMSYEALKRHCVHDLPALIPTQFMMSNKLQAQSNPRQLDQYFSNVSMKVNLKLGGSNWSLASTDLPPKRTIIMGCDVVHPNPGSKAASIAAIVATSDITASDYKAEFRMQDARVEIIQRVDEMVLKHLHAWEHKNGSKPEAIVIYRDGISDGEFHTVVNGEIAMAKKAADTFSPDRKIPITFISAGKRHRMRFFVSEHDKNRADQKGNLPPGTVVDRTVIQPLINDFYLQAHAGLIGTAKPTHYVILADENNFTADDVQRLTNSLSFVFGRATRSVSLATPCYYADIALEKARVLCATEFDDASTSYSGHSGVHEAPVATLDPDLMTAKLSRKEGFFNGWYM